MHPHITAYVPGAILLAGLACVSCSDAAPADATAPSSVRAIALSVQPEKVEPEFLPPIGRCPDARAFRTRFVVVAGGMEAFVVQELRVSFSDRFGVIAVPAVLPATGAPSGSMIDVLAAHPAADVDADPHSDERAEQRPVGVPGRLTGSAGDAGVRVQVRPRGNDHRGRRDPRRSRAIDDCIGSPSTSESEADRGQGQKAFCLALLVPERLHRVDGRRAPRRCQAGDRRNGQQQCGDAAEDDGIARALGHPLRRELVEDDAEHHAGEQPGARRSTTFPASRCGRRRGPWRRAPCGSRTRWS